MGEGGQQGVLCLASQVSQGLGTWGQGTGHENVEDTGPCGAQGHRGDRDTVGYKAIMGHRDTAGTGTLRGHRHVGTGTLGTGTLWGQGHVAHTGAIVMEHRGTPWGQAQEHRGDRDMWGQGHCGDRDITARVPHRTWTHGDMGVTGTLLG